MSLRLHVEAAPHEGTDLDLPPGASRHAQVRRVQPGHALVLFDGGGQEWPAEVLTVSRNSVRVRVKAPLQVDRELSRQVTLALVMPANDRMDALVEKATELGVTRIQPLLSERSVLRPTAERAERRRTHWQAIAVAAAEQCARARVPRVEAVRTLVEWLPAAPDGTRLLLSLQADARPPAACLAADTSTNGSTIAATDIVALSGPEGGFTADEESAALAHGFMATTLGPRVLRADTAPLALLAWLGLALGARQTK